MTGYYLMQHGWLDHPMFGDRKREPFCRAAAWAWLIDKACFAPTKVNVLGKVVELQRGQLSASVRYLAEAWGWSKSKVSRWCPTLQDANMIECTSDTGQMIITICNYDKYQSPEVSRWDSSGTAAGQQRDSSGTNKKEGKESKKEEDSPPIGPPQGEDPQPDPPAPPNARKQDDRGTRLSPDWEPSAELWQFAIDSGLEPHDTFSEFRDYWTAVPGAIGRKRDWEATGRNHVRHQAERHRKVVPISRARRDELFIFASAIPDH